MENRKELKKMKAAIYKKYGLSNVLQIKKIDRPIPKNNEVLVKIHAATVTPSDLVLRSGKFPLLFWIPVRIKFFKKILT